MPPAGSGDEERAESVSDPPLSSLQVPTHAESFYSNYAWEQLNTQCFSSLPPPLRQTHLSQSPWEHRQYCDIIAYVFKKSFLQLHICCSLRLLIKYCIWELLYLYVQDTDSISILDQDPIRIGSTSSLQYNTMVNTTTSHSPTLSLSLSPTHSLCPS